MTVPIVYRGAEEAFGLDDIDTSRAQVTGSVPDGPWLANRAGVPVAGALGILVDDVLGYSIVRARAEGRWPVSSENSLEIVRPLAFGVGHGPLQATTDGTVRTDDVGGHSAGTVTDADGEVVAVCAQRGRWVPFTDLAPHTAPHVGLGAACLEDLLGGAPTAAHDGAVLRLTVGPVLVNPLGNLHGGISLCASDLVASAAVRTWDTPWTTESLRIQYLRPVPAGSIVEFTAVVRHVGRTRAVVDVAGLLDNRLFALAHLAGRPA